MFDRRSFTAVTRLVALAVSLTAPAGASGLSDFTGIDIDFNEGTVEVGTPDPGGALERLPGQIEDLGRDLSTGGASIALASAIRYSEARAARSAAPMPPDVRADLAPFFSAEILDRARYSTDWGAAQNGTLQQFLLGNEQASAVTLGSVIVFGDGRSVSNRELWAHELVHVMQYAQLGIEEFARQYVVSSDELEGQAYDYQDQVASRLAERQQWGRPRWQDQSGYGQPSTPVVAALPSFCCTPAGRLGPYPNPGYPAGSQCYGSTPWGVAYGTMCF
jgi:hypothetical protein